MNFPQFVDISGYQPDIDWQSYKRWASQWDGNSRIAMKATEGRGFKDPSFDSHRSGALQAGIDQIIYYHFARPDLNDPLIEAAWFLSVVGEIRPQDMLFLDIETNTAGNVAEWCWQFLSRLWNYRCGIYSYPGYISSYLQDRRLSQFPLWLASWSYNPDSRPDVPQPWANPYYALQWTDRGVVPGVSGAVDVNVWLSLYGSETMSGVPTNWKDDGAALTAPNSKKVVHGFRDYVLSHTWDPNNVPLEEEHGASPVQLHRVDLGSGTRQCFRDAVLWWTPTKGVICEKQMGSELFAAYGLVNTTPIDDLQSIAAIADKYKV